MAVFGGGALGGVHGDRVSVVDVLAQAGCGHDPRLASGIQWVLSRQDDQERWKLGNSLNKKMWRDIEQRGKPSKWVTLRALRMLKAASGDRFGNGVEEFAR